MRIPDTIKVDLWPGPLTTEPTFEPTDRYPESFWLPIIGPTCLVIARRLFVRAKVGPYEQELETLALEIGLRNTEGVAKPSRVAHSLSRLCRFELARFDSQIGVYSLRSLWPLLSVYQVDRLPEHLRRLARPPEAALHHAPPC